MRISSKVSDSVGRRKAVEAGNRGAKWLMPDGPLALVVLEIMF